MPVTESNCGPTEAKMSKYENNSIKDEYSRSSFDDASDDGGISSLSFSGSVEIETETGDFVLTLKYKSRQQILQAIRGIYGETTKNELEGTCVNRKRTRDYIKKLYCKYKALKSNSNLLFSFLYLCIFR